MILDVILSLLVFALGIPIAALILASTIALCTIAEEWFQGAFFLEEQNKNHDDLE